MVYSSFLPKLDDGMKLLYESEIKSRSWGAVKEIMQYGDEIYSKKYLYINNHIVLIVY